MGRARVAVAVIAAVLVVAGCGSSSDTVSGHAVDSRTPTATSHPGATTATASAMPTAAPDTTASTVAPGSSTVAPATGTRLEVRGVTIALPVGWAKSRALATFQASGTKTGVGIVGLTVFPTVGDDPTSTENAVLSTLDLPRSALRPRETHAGRTFVHAVGVSAAPKSFYDEYATVIKLGLVSNLVSVMLESERNNSVNEAQAQAVLDPMIASITLP